MSAIALPSHFDILLPESSQIWTGSVRSGHLFYLQEHYGRNKNAYHVNYRQTAAYDAWNKHDPHTVMYLRILFTYVGTYIVAHAFLVWESNAI